MNNGNGNINLNDVLQYYKYLEKLSHISTDDVINKVTQEVAEIVEADFNEDKQSTYSEAGDALANIYSISEELGLNTELKENTELNKDKSHSQLMILLGKWNNAVQGYRERYSREKVNIEELQDTTADLVQEILSYSNPDKSIEKTLLETTNKFESRVLEYKPEIDLKQYIKNYPDFPKEGINFKDISPILESPEAFRYVIMELIEKCHNSDVIVGLDSRGFLFGTMVAEYLGKPFVMVRKKGKLPGKTKTIDYGLEYGNDVIEMQEGGIKEGQKVSVIDDLLATGGTAKAAIELVEQSGGEVNNVSFVISLDEPELVEKENRKELEKYNINSIVNYN